LIIYKYAINQASSARSLKDFEYSNSFWIHEQKETKKKKNTEARERNNNREKQEERERRREREEEKVV